MAETYNFTIYQGETFTRTVTWTDSAGNPINLTGYTIAMQARPTASSYATLFSLSIGSGITVPTPANGSFVITLSATATRDLPCGGVYDIELTNAGVVTRLIQGSFSLSTEITR